MPRYIYSVTSNEKMTATTEPNITVVDDSSPGPFEGPEKLLELWFAPSEHDVPQTSSDSRDGAARRRGQSAGSNSAKWTGLRQVERSVWDSMLDEVQCKVLSVIEGDDVDAYLLRWVWRQAFQLCAGSPDLRLFAE